jgi:hypothetical protein
LDYRIFETSEGIWSIEDEHHNTVREYLGELELRQWFSAYLKVGDTLDWEKTCIDSIREDIGQ